MSQPTPKVSIVILNFNTRSYLEKYLPSVLATNYANFEVVVADNGSEDGSLALVEAKFPSVIRLQLSKNYGFAEGYNQALQQNSCAYIVLLNSDVEVDPDWLQPMMDLMLSDEKVGAIQPKIRDLNNRDSFEYAGASGGMIDYLGYPFCRGRIFNHLEKDAGQYDEPISVFWATGAAMLVRKSAFDEAGRLDGEFFAHMEEIDLCWRMQNLGYKVMSCPKGIIYHLGGGTLSSSSARKTYLNFRNNLILLAKNLPTSEVFPKIFMRLVLDGLAGFQFLLKGQLSHISAIVKAHWSFFTRFSYWRTKGKSNKRRSMSGLSGYYSKSIVFQHFVKGVKEFSKLPR